MKRLGYRLQEWMANRFDSAQYPREQQQTRKRFAWRYDMPLLERFGLGMLFLAMFLFFGGLLIVLCIVAWAFISSI